MKQIISRALLGACAAALISSTAYSQSSNTLEEIVVTAQKREQSLQDVGIAITAFSGDTLKDMGIDSIKQLQDHTPNLRIKGTLTGVPQYSIRGVGENADTSALSSSPVAVHVNEVAQPYPVTASNLLFDLERVEVLRGPQGDLFGLNTTGGTVNYITHRPTDEFEASIMAEFGNYDRTRLIGYISGPLSDSFSARIAVSQNKRSEGWQVNEVTGEELGEFEKTGARLSLNFSPSDTFNADLEWHFSRDDSDAMGFRNVSNFFGLDIVPLLIDSPDFLLFASTATADNGTGWTSYTRGAEMETIGLVDTDLFPAGTKPFVDNEGSGGSLAMTWDLGSVSLTSVTGYEKFEREELNDSDGDEIQDSNQYFTSDLDMWSQELRLASTGDNAVKWMIGANVAADELVQKTLFVQTENLDFPGVGGQNPTQERDIWAIFGHVDWSLSEKLELVTGLRYTSETRKQSNVSTFKMGMPTDGVELLSGGVFVPDLNDPFAPGTPLTDGDFSCFFFVGPPCGPGFVESDKVSSEEVSGKIGLNYFASDAWMLYGSFSRGFKSGGFLDTAASVSGSFANSKPEFLNAWEVGAKGQFADGRGRLNAALFFYDYEDQQVNDSLVDPLFGPLGVIVNAPDTEIYGGEIEFAFVSGGFEILQNIGYSKGEFKEFIGVDADASRAAQDPVTGLYPTVTVNRAGESLEMPEIQYSGTIAYTADISSRLSTRFVLDYSYEDKLDSGSRTWTDPITGVVSEFDLPSYWVVNARASLMNNESWEVTLFADNLFDEEYLLQYTRFNQAVVQAVGMPRTYGLRLTYDF